jgi:RNA polymerase sigma-70 factor (ECF subfamily)
VEPEPGFFRRQSGRLVSTLTRIFGVRNVALAEDVTQDALCRALSVWQFSGVPDDPAAWLMAVARNRAIDILRRDRNARRFAPDLGFLLDSEWTLAPTVIDLFEPRAVTDGELRMMFSCSAPGLPEEAQVALILHILCGFSNAEVAGALLSSVGATEKRIARAKKTLASTPSSRSAFLRCSGRSISCSTRDTTALRPRSPCASACAARRCTSPGCSSSIRCAPSRARVLSLR